MCRKIILEGGARCPLWDIAKKNMAILDYSYSLSADEIYDQLQKASKKTKEELENLGLKEGMTQAEIFSILDRTSDATYGELIELGVFGPVITLDQIQQICSGVNASGEPNAYAALSIDTITSEMQAIPYANISFGNPILNFYAGGGCAVVTADFRKSGMFEYRRAREILNEWIEKKGAPDFDDKLLSFSVFPVAANGLLSLIYHEVVYAQGIPMEDGTCRIIMAFDGNQTQELADSNIRLDELKAIVDAEISRSEAEAKEAAKQNQETQEDVNPYEQSVEEEYTPSFLKEDLVEMDEGYENRYGEEENSVGEENAPEDSWMRITKE